MNVQVGGSLVGGCLVGGCRVGERRGTLDWTNRKFVVVDGREGIREEGGY